MQSWLLGVSVDVDLWVGGSTNGWMGFVLGSRRDSEHPGFVFPSRTKQSQGALCTCKDCKRSEGVKGMILLLLLSLWVPTLASKGKVPTIK